MAIPTRATESFPNVHTRVLKYYHLFFQASNLVKVAPRDAAERRRRARSRMTWSGFEKKGHHSPDDGDDLARSIVGAASLRREV